MSICLLEALYPRKNQTMTILFEELNNEQRIEMMRHNHVEWGGKLDFKEYCKRESFCHQFLETRAFGLLSNGKLVASLESYIRKGVFNEEEEDIYSIATVYVPKEHRRNGFASVLFEELTTLMDKSDIKSVLFSDVKHFYNRFEYKTFEGEACVLDPKISENPISYLQLGDLPQISKLNEMVYNQLKKSGNILYVIDDANVFQFPYSRELFYRCNSLNPNCTIEEMNATWHNNTMNKTLKRASSSSSGESLFNHDLVQFPSAQKPLAVNLNIGAFIEKEDGSYGYILWTAIVHKKKYTDNIPISEIQEHRHLTVISLQVFSKSAEAKQRLEIELLQCAQQYAYEDRLDKVVMWSFEFPHLQNTKLEDCWPAMRPKDMAWKNMMRYTWC